MTQNKRKEVYDFTHKEITVTVMIDYVDNEISLLDRNGDSKKWLFSNRGVEFMNGWLTILEAMSLAVVDAKKKYEANLAAVSAFKPIKNKRKQK